MSAPSFSLPDDLTFNSSRNLTLQTTLNLLYTNPYYVPSVDKTPDRLQHQMTCLQKSNNEKAAELYRGRMPSSCIDDLEANRRELVQEQTSKWKDVSKEELSQRIQKLNAWIDEKVSDIVLGPCLASRAREESSDFLKDMTEVAIDMAKGHSDGVKAGFTDLLASDHRHVHEFLMHDQVSNKSHFYEALVAHFVDPEDSSYNPFKLITLDRRSTQAEPLRQFKKRFNHIKERIGPQGYEESDSYVSEKAAKTREEAVRYRVQAWTDPKDDTHKKRERLPKFLGSRRVTYLPLSTLTAESGTSNRPVVSGTNEQDGRLTFDSRPITAVSNGHETDSSHDLGTEPARVEFL